MALELHPTLAARCLAPLPGMIYDFCPNRAPQEPLIAFMGIGSEYGDVRHRKDAVRRSAYATNHSVLNATRARGRGILAHDGHKFDELSRNLPRRVAQITRLERALVGRPRDA